MTLLLHATAGRAEVWCSGRELGNIGDHVGDAPEVVARNRAAIADAAGLPQVNEWMWLRQVHGALVADADADAALGEPPEADASVTATSGRPLAIVTADCAPVVLANDDACAVVHAGHRGLLAGVLASAVDAVRARGEGEVRAYLGPCIHAECYEFGEHDLASLVARFGTEVAGRTASGRPALDIPSAVRTALAQRDVTNLDDCGICTAHDPGYFSYRREGQTGRQVTVAVLR